MKITSYHYPQSSFLSLEKDMSIIMDLFLQNDNLKKMLYYTSSDCLQKPPLTEDQSLELIGNNIKIVPKLYIDNTVLNYVLIRFDHFTPNGNPEFKDNIIEFDIVCHFDQWHMKDFQLRPFKIAAEIDSMLNNKRLTGIGTLQFASATQHVITDEYAIVCLMYVATHGEEDKKKMPNPMDEEQFQENFDKIFNE